MYAKRALPANACIGKQIPMRIKTAETLGELVRDQRKQRGWSQTRLAEKVGVSRLWVSQLENGKETVEFGLVLKTLRALDLALGVSRVEKNPLPGGLLER
jgi:y4mF family transcriptional regulator